MICKVCNKESNEFYLNDFLSVKTHNLCNKCFIEFIVIKEKYFIDKYPCYSLYEYKGKIKELIYQFKGLKDYELKDIFLEYFLDEINCKYFGYVITFAPSYYLDDEERGFNHVEAMFSSLKNKKIPLFKKITNYKQSDQNYYERKNISKIIELDKNKIKGLKKVLIVDDVLTSGNTLKVCADLLFNEGVRDIKLLTVSKTSNYR